jgi:hypothetical protein
VQGSVCLSCSAVSTRRTARFCGRCGGLLSPTTPASEGPSEDPVVAVEDAGAGTLEPPRATSATHRRRRGTRSPWLAGGLVVISVFAGVMLQHDRREPDVPSEAAEDAVGGQPVQPVEGERSPKRGDVIGLWSEVGDDDRLGVLLSFARDGTFRWDDEGLIGSDPAVRGIWELSRGAIRVTSEGSARCDDGASWSWQVEYPRAGRLDIEPTEAVGEDVCGIAPGAPSQLYRLAPEPAIVAQRGAPEAAGSRPPTAADLRGVWVRVEAGDRLGPVVSFHTEGTYATDDVGNLDGGSVGRGSWALDGDLLTLTSAGAPTCREGEGWAWQVEAAPPGQLDVVIVQPGDHGGCPTAEVGTQETFLQVSPLTPASAHRLVADASSHELSVAWNGDGCDHDVPATLPAGTHTVTTENGHADRLLGLMIRPFQPGQGHEDLLAWLGPELPSTKDVNAMPLLEQDGYRIRATAGSRTITDVTLTAGEYALVCWLRGPPATEWWPVGSLTVIDHTDASSRTDHESEDATALATAHAYLTARDAFDAVTARELLANDATVTDAFHFEVDELGPAFKALQLMDFRLSPFHCEVAPSTGAPASEPDDGVEVLCPYTVDSRLQRNVGYGPIEATFALTVVDGLITSSSDGFPYDEFGNVWAPFGDYLDERQVSNFVLRIRGGIDYPELTPDALKLLAVTLDDYDAWTEDQRTDTAN